MMKSDLLEMPLLSVSPSKMNLPGEIGVLVLRIAVSLMVFHHAFQKLAGPEGFATNVVGKYFPFLPFPLLWTYLAAYMEIVLPILLVLGVFARTAAFGLFGTMVFANTFHFMAHGFEGFPTTSKGPAYTFEPSFLCGAIFFYFLMNGPGKLALLPKLF
mmetsp:Transcript_44517/g.74033  ORF Transcript_44517/g.74033 Transcript_44517/m.74033 type:complete len:158 (-) Transcript_44517:278-751(-)